METLHPGLYVQEVGGTPPMEGVSTSTGAFVGVAKRGKIGEPKLITSFSQFVNEFGDFTNDGYLAYAVRQFFQNGGARCYVTRTCHYDTDGSPTASASSADIMDSAGTNPAMTVNAKSEGTWGDKLEFEVKEFSDSSSPYSVSVEVRYEGEKVEEYNLDDSTDLENEVNSRSNYVNITVTNAEDIAVEVADLTGGDDGLTDLSDSDYVGDSAEGNGLYSFDNVNVNTVAIPGIGTEIAHQGIKTYCEGRKDCFGILDAPIDNTPSEVKTYVEDNNLASSYVAFYYPWVEVSDPIGAGKNPTKLLPPSGAMAGIYARTDNSRGVWKAPAGYETNILGALDLGYDVTNGEQDTLNPDGINCLRSFDDAGIIAWGARTLSSDPEYKYISTRRLVIYVESSLKESMGWAVFEPNDSDLWSKLNASISDFLRLIWKAGGLKGKKEEDAFWVKCDETINTEEVIDSGRVYVDIGLADQKPAEFIVFRISLI